MTCKEVVVTCKEVVVTCKEVVVTCKEVVGGMQVDGGLVGGKVGKREEKGSMVGRGVGGGGGKSEEGVFGRGRKVLLLEASEKPLQ